MKKLTFILTICIVAVTLFTACSEPETIEPKIDPETTFITDEFTDANFRAYLLEYIPGRFVNFDTNRDGEISIAEAEKITRLWIGNKNIESLNGIEYLTNLELLEAPNNQIQTLDITKNINLTEVNCRNNKLTILDITKNNKLIFVDCTVNPKLTNLYVKKGYTFDIMVDNINVITPK